MHRSDSHQLILTHFPWRTAFYSAGQRCSALRVLYIQEEIYDNLCNLIREATEILKIGDTADFSNDIGAVIDRKSFDNLARHISYMEKAGFTR
ncbi:aldehyde dehydrogenase family protein [Candidatus Megaera polyxenophila]|uniref:aldehyde dehydrogenase family protein n=1 Tax=Candidatus Megaera polyxenophila TaxID=988779 RepID=UPI0039778E64